MLYIRNAADSKAALTVDEHLTFIKQCEVYIGRLKAEGKLIAAQPIVRKRLLFQKMQAAGISIDPTKEVQVGYYHISARDIDEAISIAKDNPEFEFVPSASIAVRPIKMKEEQTDFIYPNS